MTLEQRVAESAGIVRERIPAVPEIAIVLGSGLGDFADTLDSPVAIDASTIPHYPRSTVPGHRGRLVVGGVGGKRVLTFQGRIHFYESNDLEAVLYPIHLALALGVRNLIVTNAAGGVNRSFRAGDLMLISDQMNLTLDRYPLPSSSRRGSPFDARLMTLARESALSLGIDLKEGVYAGMKGPSYETAAEVEMIYRLGGDAVGMSTVFEVLLASGGGMSVLGISCITNLATGISKTPLSHGEVTEAGLRVKSRFERLLRSIVSAI